MKPDNNLKALYAIAAGLLVLLILAGAIVYRELTTLLLTL